MQNMFMKMGKIRSNNKKILVIKEEGKKQGEKKRRVTDNGIN